MHTYKTLNELENEASEQKLDHVLNHPFFAKKSSLQEKISKPKEGDGHNHSSETMNQYKAEHEKNGIDVTKSKPKRRPSESGNIEQQKNAHASYDIDELELDESCGCEDVTSKVDGRTKAYRETYTRIMNRLSKLREKAKKNNMEQYGEEN
tara:strand:+ start:196 stop:648 length:453 start_codon:yes stop_codon:yes gene_type:complete